MTRQNKRQRERIPVESPIHIRWRGFSGEPHFEPGTVLDFSENGLRVEVSKPIDPAAFVVAGQPGQTKHACVGRVRYCVPKRTKYMVGLQLYPRTEELSDSIPNISKVLSNEQYSLLMFRP